MDSHVLSMNPEAIASLNSNPFDSDKELELFESTQLKDELNQPELGLPTPEEIPKNVLKIPTHILNTGATCPGIGYGTGGEGRATPDELLEALSVAIKAGYRSFDSAPFYQDGLVEQTVGRAIRESGIPRSEFFITTKVWPTYSRCPEDSLDNSLKNLGLEYVDCLLLHWPIPLKQVPGDPYALGEIWDAGWDFKKTWLKMQEISTSKAKAVGVCNFTVNRLRLLLSHPGITKVPAVLQMEGHPELPQWQLLKFCKEKQIQVFCFSPLAQGQVTNSIIMEIAKKHNVGSGQVALSWGVLRGTVPLPKSVNHERIITNIELINLDEEDLKALKSLGKVPRRIVNPRIFFGHDIFENNADSYGNDSDEDEPAEEDDIPKSSKKKRSA